MKNTCLLLGLGLLFVACGGEKSDYDKYYESNYEPDTTQVTGPSPQANAGQQPEMPKGAKLISLSDCLSCHRENEKLIGPAYAEVAQKYEATEKNIDYLAGKIINGGSGVWGQVPMTAHPDISKEDAREMASYILSLRTQ